MTPDWVAYPPGTLVALEAFPNPDKSFNKWKLFDPNFPGDANYATNDTTNPITITMMADREVEGAFKCGSSAAPLLPIVLVLLGLLAIVRRKA